MRGHLEAGVEATSPNLSFFLNGRQEICRIFIRWKEKETTTKKKNFKLQLHSFRPRKQQKPKKTTML